MGDLNKGVLEVFDELAVKLRDYDAQTEGGGAYLVATNNFTPVAKSKLDLAQRHTAMLLHNAFHRVVKAASLEDWSDWFRDCCSDQEGTPQEQLERTISRARTVVERTDFARNIARQGVEGTTAHFLERVQTMGPPRN